MKLKVLPTPQEYLKFVVRAVVLPKYAMGFVVVRHQDGDLVFGEHSIDWRGKFREYESLNVYNCGVYLQLLNEVPDKKWPTVAPYHEFIEQQRGNLPQREFTIDANYDSWEIFRQIKFGVYHLEGKAEAEGRVTWEYGGTELVLYGKIKLLKPVLRVIEKEFKTVERIDLYVLTDLLSSMGWRNTTPLDNE